MSWLIAVLLASAPPPTGVPPMLGFVDAASLSGFCTAAGDKARDGKLVCLSYVTGAVDQLLAEQSLRTPDDRTICVPSDVTAAGVMRAVTAYAGWSKSGVGISGASFVRYALERAYPCDLTDARPM